MPPRIPTPELIGEAIDGAVYNLPGGKTLVVGGAPSALSDQQPILRGALVARYALPLLQPPTDAVIPGLFAAEKGGMLVGREAWDYIQEHFQMHPRADIVGLHPNGTQAQVFLRELDFGAPVRVLLYDGPTATVPGAEAQALYMGDNAPPLPDLLSKYLSLRSLESLLRP
jgi:hypothetical protein